MEKLVLYFIAVMFVSCLNVHAGSNENAYLYLDNNFKTNQIETVLSDVNENDTCFVGVMIERAVNLNAYSLKLQFDTSIVTPCIIVPSKSISEQSFLESSGKKSIFLTKQNGNEVEFAATLQGTGFSVSGNGALAYIIFKCKKNGNPGIVLKEVKLIDTFSTIDVFPK